MPPTLDPNAAARDFILRWEKSAAAERANFHLLRALVRPPQGNGTKTAPVKVEKVDWPKTMADQAKAVRAALVASGGVVTPDQLAGYFKGARKDRLAALPDPHTSRPGPRGGSGPLRSVAAPVSAYGSR